MRYVRLALCALVTCGLAAGPAAAASGGLDAWRVKATAKNLASLRAAGFDVGEGRDSKRGTIDVVGTAAQIAAAKLDAQRLTDYAGDARRASTRAPTDGATDAAFTVWTKYDAVPDDGKEQYTEQYDRIIADFPGIAAKRVTGTSVFGRDIVAIQVTKGATGNDIPGRPAVLYNALQHAREWLAGETCRRTLDYFTSNYGKGTSAGKEVTALVDSVELWFVCVNNPDGYEFTFTPGHRLWRKNIRDNNANGTIELGDGVDPNRNFSSNWGRDDEGSSPDPASETYRGTGPASEPETTAMEALFAEIHPVFQKNDHTAAELLLYPQGFQQDTRSADNEIFTALAGDRFKPGIQGFLPELSAGLYITNGDFTDWAYSTQKTLSFTPEGTAAEDPNVSGFEYPDSPLQVRQEFERHLPFILDLAHSAADPAEAASHLGNKPRDFAVDAFPLSYGDPQLVGATIKRELGDAFIRYRINGGPVVTRPVADYNGGERHYKDKGVYYRRVRGVVTGTTPGDKVEVWFAAGGKESDHFTYDAVSESTNPVLLLVNEDWSGKQPNPTPLTGPSYLNTYRAALDAAGVQYDVYDVDANDRRAPNQLGILSHYSHVVWETGDDYVPREPDAPGGSGITKLAVDTQNEVRDFINDGGKLFFTGRNAGRVFAEGFLYNPFQAEEQTYCQNANPACIIVQDDFLQYWLGAYRYVGTGGEDANGNPFPVQGTSGPFDPLDFEIGGDNTNQNTATLLTTSSVLDPAQYPLWADSTARGAWLRPYASPFAPHAGDWFLSAGATDAAYKRLAKQFATPAGGATLKFWTSYDLEPDYDFMFVEIHTVGQDDWTTLEDANGYTSQNVGLSCPATGAGSNWQSIHPFLAHYQTKNAQGDDCAPTGSSGAWNATTGNSGGWQQWSVAIPAAYLGKNVEISVSVASDPATLGLGVWLDELQLVDATDAPIQSPDPSFETDYGGWTRPGPPTTPPGEGQSAELGWDRAQTAPFVETPIVTTTDTVYTGFGFERIVDETDRNDFMKSVFGFLGAPSKPTVAVPAAIPEPPPSGGTGGPGGEPGGGPAPGTPPPAAAGGLLSRLRVLTPQSLRTALRRGVLLEVRCSRACALRADLNVSPRMQRKLGLATTRVGRRTFTLRGGGVRLVRVRLSANARQALARVRSVRLFLSVLQTDVHPARRATGRLLVTRSRLAGRVHRLTVLP